jgi:hypothetical protein
LTPPSISDLSGVAFAVLLVLGWFLSGGDAPDYTALVIWSIAMSIATYRAAEAWGGRSGGEWKPRSRWRRAPHVPPRAGSLGEALVAFRP